MAIGIFLSAMDQTIIVPSSVCNLFFHVVELGESSKIVSQY